MKQLVYLISCVIFSFHSINAQTTYSLEQLDLSTSSIDINTFLMGINNKGFICGYGVPVSTTDTIGFVITPEGKLIEIDQTITGVGSVGIKAVSINDSNLVLVNYLDASGNSKLHKCMVNNHYIVWHSAISGLQQNSVKAFHMNNKGDITGWYPGVNRWLFVLHQGTPPAGFNAWQAWRYNVFTPPSTYTYYNTMGGAMDTNRIACGFYIDGSLNKPFLYDELYAGFYPLTGSNWCHPYGKNNNGKIVGEYRNTNNFVNAFVASPTYTPGNYSSGVLNLSSLAFIFHGDSIYSIARAINDSDEVVGYFLDPSDNRYKGFVYHPNRPDFHLEGYDFTKHVWKMYNSSDAGSPNSVDSIWSENFYGGFDYTTTDPFANNGIPLLEPFISSDTSITNYYTNGVFGDTNSVSWKEYMTEMVQSDVYLNYAQSSNPLLSNTYRYLYKPAKFRNYIRRYAGLFQGYCYGFAATSLLHFKDDQYLNTNYNIGTSTQLNTYDNTSFNAVLALGRAYLKQWDIDLKEYYPKHRDSVKPWRGLYRMKQTFLRKDTTHYRQLYIGWISSPAGAPVQYSYHSIMPYKIKTPVKLPFNYNGVFNTDTVYVYDSNDPLNQNSYLWVNSNYYNNGILASASMNYPANGFFTAFNEVSIGEMEGLLNTHLKGKKRGMDSIARIYLAPQSQFTIVESGTGNTAILDNTGFNSSIDKIVAIEPKNNSGVHIDRFLMDTSAHLQIQSTNYLDSTMYFHFENDRINMGLSRKALPGETDHATIKNNFIAYGNPDNVTKYFSADFDQLDPGAPTGCAINISGLGIPANDSIITIHPNDYQYQIIHPGNGNITYSLNVIAVYNDTVKQFTANNVSISGQGSHIIDPYFAGSQGPQTAVLVDMGNNGIFDDTLFVVGAPLGTQNIRSQADYIQVVPNPVQTQLQVKIDLNEAQHFRLAATSLQGKLLFSESINHKGGSATYTFPIQHLPDGIFYVIVLNDKQELIHLEKVIKQQ